MQEFTELIVAQCGMNECPAVYLAANGDLIVQGTVVVDVDAPEGQRVVRIPRHLLLDAIAILEARNS